MQKDNRICRGLALLLCLAMVVGFLPAGIFSGLLQVNAVSTQEVVDDNLVSNGGFDGDLDTVQNSWGISFGAQSNVEIVDGAVQVTAASVRNEDGSYATDENGTAMSRSQTYLTQNFTEVKAYDLYELTVKYKWVSGDSIPYVGLWFFKDDTSNANYVGSTTKYLDDKSGEWVTVTLTAVAPTGCNIMQLEMGNSTGCIVTYALDDVTLVKKGSYVYSEMFDAFNNNKGSAGPKGWVDSDINNENLVGCYGGDLGSAYSGYALHFQQADALWAESPTFNVKAGYDYTVKFMAKKTTNNNSFTGYGAIIFLDAEGNEIGSREKLVGRYVGTWTEEYFIGVAPEGAVKAYLLFGCDKVDSAYGIDNLTVSESAGVSDRDPAATDPDEEAPEYKFTLNNGDFEDGLTGWNGGSGSGATNELVDGYKGQGLKLTAQATENDRAINTFYQDLGVAGLKALELKVVSKVAQLPSADSGYVGLWFYDENGTLTPENTAFTIRLGDTADWTEYSLIQAVPADATRVRVEFGNNSGCSGLFFMLDEISLEVYTGPEENIKPAVPSTGGGGGGGTKYPAAIVDPSELNASFEELDENGVPVGWRVPGNKNFWAIVQAADAPNGKNVFQLSTNKNGGQVNSSRIAVENGKTYEMKIMAKDIEGAQARLGIYVYDVDGTRIDDACVVVTTNGSGRWKMYTAVTAIPDDDRSYAIECEVWYATGQVSTVQIDAMVLQESKVVLKPAYRPTPYEYPTIEQLTENLTDVYPRVYFTPEEAKEIKLRRFNTIKTKYGWTWNKQYDTLLSAADAAFNTTEVRVSMNTGKYVYMNIWEDVNSQHNRDQYLAASFADDGSKFEEPYTGFGCLIQTQLSTMMKNWSLAYTMTGKTKYSDQAIKMAMNVASWEWWIDKNWTDKKNIHADASIAWMMEGMVAVYDMCYNEMTPEQRKTLERSIIEKGLIPLSKQVNPNSTVNGNMMMVGGILSGAAVILNEDNAEEIYPYLCVGLLAMHNALDNYAFSGNTEGHYYTDFGLETFVPGVGHLYNATHMDGIIDHYFFTDILPYWTVMWAANQTGTHPNYSDASINAYMKIPMAVLAKLTNDPIVDGFLVNAGNVGGAFENLVYLKADPKPEYITDYAGIIEEFGYGALRTGFADDDMLLTLKANDSQMGHNHYDQNGILFAAGASWLINDPGSGSYYYADRSFWVSEGHSTILIDGAGQSVIGTGETKLVFNNNLYSYLVGSAARAYGEDFDSPMADKFDRHAIQVNHEDKGYYVIIDDLAASKDRIYTWQMFNGSRQTFSVDDVEVPEETLVMGNKVSMPMGKNVLNLNFIDSDKLEIGDKVHYSGSARAGLTLVANSAATKTHQFMTVISTDSNSLSTYISFYDILGGNRSTLPEYSADNEISWDSSMPLGQEILKPNMIGTTPCVFFRGNKAGDWLQIPVLVEETGDYEVKLTMGISDGCCTIKATIGDKTVENIDCSGLPEDFVDIDFGVMTLEAGYHNVRLEVTDKGYDEDYEPGWYLINAGGIDLMRVGVEIPPANDLSVTEVIDNEEALAGMINYKDNKFDFLMWNRTEGAATAGLLNTDAQQASVLGLIEGVITEGFAATAATTLTYDGKVLFLAEKDVDIVASSTGWQIISDEAQTVQLTAVAPELDYVVTVNGEAADAKIENGILTVAVAAGETKIALDVEEPVVEDPTEPTETDPTEPAETDPTVAPTEPAPVEDGNDATLWIIIAVIAVLLVGAAVGVVLFLKKRKNA